MSLFRLRGTPGTAGSALSENRSSSSRNRQQQQVMWCSVREKLATVGHRSHDLVLVRSRPATGRTGQQNMTLRTPQQSQFPTALHKAIELWHGQQKRRVQNV
jgi:hypothetical protein